MSPSQCDTYDWRQDAVVDCLKRLILLSVLVEKIVVPGFMVLFCRFERLVCAASRRTARILPMEHLHEFDESKLQ